MHIIILSDCERRGPLRGRSIVSFRSCDDCAILSADANGICKLSFETIAPYTIEEAYEVADAIANDDMDALVDELGDLQLQVVFHSQMHRIRPISRSKTSFERICSKMERRHPHIFGDAEHGGQHLGRNQS